MIFFVYNGPAHPYNYDTGGDLAQVKGKMSAWTSVLGEGGPVSPASSPGLVDEVEGSSLQRECYERETPAQKSIDQRKPSRQTTACISFPPSEAQPVQYLATQRRPGNRTDKTRQGWGISACSFTARECCPNLTWRASVCVELLAILARKTRRR